MEFDFTEMAPLRRYELLLGAVVPRPIAMIISMNRGGVINAAPYSLFGVMSHDPPIVAFSVLPNSKGLLKDTANNILASGEFVVSLVPEALAEAMNMSCIDSPPEVSEIELTGLQTQSSRRVKPPRLAESPVSFECKFRTSISFGPGQAIIFGEVELAHIGDQFVLDAETCALDTPALKLFGAMHAARYYARTGDLFDMVRPTWADRTKT